MSNKPAHQHDVSQPQIMGILNVTPDSFSDGGLWLEPEKAVAHARKMLAEGAVIIDIGGESTRPGAEPVSVDEECARVLPVIAAIVEQIPEAVISVDTSKAQVMRAAAGAGAQIINDVNALRAEGALAAAVSSGCRVCLMHMQGEPRSMQAAPHYENVVSDIRMFLQERIDACLAAGMDRTKIMIDPGFGFGKTLQHNLDLLQHLDALQTLGYPVLVGLSRKSMFARIIPALAEQTADRRVYAGVAAAILAVQKGAHIIRTHDVAATRDALAVLQAVQQSVGLDTVK